ncbi:hypothetical protein OG535_13290 [Kitasatospora sp. NBC_00085]|uniref:hypothetical protein n=1 Tax=Kitasatospora sp. NBC_00085 TaxID=2903566 RepID=UPI0032541E09
MPTQDQDPDVNSAREAQQQYLTALQRTRSDYRLSDLAKAEAIDAAYTAYLGALQAAWDRLQERRRKRLEYLEGLVPVGPGIADGTSPADRTVLMTAFRTAYDRALDTNLAGRARMLADAERFDDDAVRRGTLTAVVDLSEINTLRAWSEHHLTTAAYLPEVGELREAIALRSTRADHRVAQQAFQAARVPEEVRALPRLQRLAEAAARPASRFA